MYSDYISFKYFYFKKFSLIPVVNFPKCSSRSLKCLAVYFKYLNTLTICSFFSWQPSPRKSCCILRLLSPLSHVGFPFLWIPCFSLPGFTTSFAEAHILVTHYQEKVHGKDIFELSCIWNLFILFSCLNDHLGGHWIICSSFKSIFGSLGLESIRVCVQSLVLFWFPIPSKRPGSFLR